ncbi:MAG: hypothetical protein ACOCZK_02035, partial [Planctomycetota bacterium]
TLRLFATLLMRDPGQAGTAGVQSTTKSVATHATDIDRLVGRVHQRSKTAPEEKVYLAKMARRTAENASAAGGGSRGAAKPRGGSAPSAKAPASLTRTADRDDDGHGMRAAAPMIASGRA